VVTCMAYIESIKSKKVELSLNSLLSMLHFLAASTNSTESSINLNSLVSPSSSNKVHT